MIVFSVIQRDCHGISLGFANRTTFTPDVETSWQTLYYPLGKLQSELEYAKTSR